MKILGGAICISMLCLASLEAQLVPGRYIVEFREKPAVGRAAVRVEQSRMRPQLLSAGARIRSTIETVANAAVV